jgi:hypothetical protein
MDSSITLFLIHVFCELLIDIIAINYWLGFEVHIVVLMEFPVVLDMMSKLL